MPSKKPSSKKSKSDKPKVEKKVEEPKVEKKVEEPKVEVPSVFDSKVEPPSINLMEYEVEITKLQSDLKSALQLIKDLVVHVNAFDKKINREKKVVDKKMRGKVRRTGENKTISGFSKPGPISDELRTFLNLGKDELIARTEVTKKITTYCKENNLQNLDDKRIILPDKPLQKLLRIKKTDQLTYFNLQKYMKVHFPNKEGVYPTA
jgi:chromatin remodeling complex protein RSC6